MGVDGQRHAPAALYPRQRTGTHCIGGRVGPRACLDGCGKSRSPPGFDPRTVQPVVSTFCKQIQFVPHREPVNCWKDLVVITYRESMTDNK
jgi:hypothetical protein